MKYKWILLDADGTLFDYEYAERHSLELMFRENGIRFRKEYLLEYHRVNEELFRCLEKGTVTPDELRIVRFERLFSKYGIKSNAAEVSQQYLSHLSNISRLFPSAFETVEALSQGVNIAIVTNGMTEVQKKRISSSGLSPFISAVIISEDAGTAKPSEKFFSFVFDRIGNPDKKLVLIAGDSLTSDIKGGYEFHIDTCWYNPGELSNHLGIDIDYEIKELNELLSICEVELDSALK